ncbi:MAG: histidine kinase [Microbacteriaceae bacterium]|jgi:two-component system OmpR family sensor kinase|nr:histidine kinase [Microbacteriaceae bacterium]
MTDALSTRWNSTSLRTKMTAVSVLLLTVGLLVAGLGSMSVLRDYLTKDTDQKVNNLLLSVDSAIEFRESDAAGLTCDVAPIPTTYYIGVVDDTGALLCSNKQSPDAHPATSALSDVYTWSQDEAVTVASEPGSGSWRVVSTPGATRSGHFINVVVGYNLNEVDEFISQYAAIFLFFGLTVVVLGGAVTRLLVTSTFNPLREVEATAARFAAGDFTQRLGGATQNTEVGRLNRSLNAMLSQIDRAFSDRAKTIDQMRRFVGDASHELRTPLVSVRGYAELYRMGALQNPEDVAQAMERIEKEAIRMGELVTDLLELARIDEAKPLQLEEVDLIPLAQDAALDAMASSPGREVNVVVSEIDAPPPTADDPATDAATPTVTRTAALATGPIGFAGATIARLRRRPRTEPTDESDEELIEVGPTTPSAVVLAEENKIRQVITNLMGNAMRFAPEGTPIEISVEADRAHGLAIISVIDHGEGIPPQIREKIFQRFWRADSSRNRDTGGSGLGLAIVASIIAAHKGTVDVVETPGGGATFRVILPLHHSAAETTRSTEPQA